jgi:hypothetical protein
MKPAMLLCKLFEGRPVLLIEIGKEDTWEPRDALYIFLDGKGACSNIRREEAAVKQRYEVMPLAEYEKLPVGAYSLVGTPK